MRRAALFVVIGVSAAVLLGGVVARASTPSAERAQARRFLLYVEANSPVKKRVAQRLEIVDGNGAVIRVVAEGSFPNHLLGGALISPDGRSVAWLEGENLFVERVTGSKPRLLVGGLSDSAAGGAESFAWSPNSKKLLLAVAHLSKLVTVSLRTGARQQIVPAQRGVTFTPVGWSRAAHRILFLSENTYCAAHPPPAPCWVKLVLARPSGAAQRTIYSAVDQDHDLPVPAFSPNGKWVAFTTEGRDPHDPRCAIVAVATGQTTPVPDYTGYARFPAWSPTSTRFAAGSQLISPTGKQVGTLKDAAGDPLAWTHHGIYLLSYPPRRSRLLIIRDVHKAPRIAFTLPRGQNILSAQPF
jgi:WD40-like Beta Propeller Repeat